MCAESDVEFEGRRLAHHGVGGGGGGDAGGGPGGSSGGLGGAAGHGCSLHAFRSVLLTCFQV